MTLSGHFQQALVNLMAAKLRSFLAVLGVLVGTAAVVALISCGSLATEKALSQFKTLGTDLLAVSVYQKTDVHMGSNQAQIGLNFWRKIPQILSAVLQVAPYSTAYKPIIFEGKTLSGVIIGADESLAKIVHVELARGRFMNPVEVFEHVCVIGANLALQMQALSLEDPIGRQLRIGQALYTIIGVARPWKESGFFNEDLNQALILPVGGMSLIAKDVKINNAVFLMRANIDINTISEQIKTILSKQAPDLNVFIRSAKQIIANMESQGQIFTLLLAVIGGISLLVGGIGIMNVMLVAVSERKKEIGIRKAVGAKNSEIQMLFLVESVMLSLVGGVFGVILGLVFTWIVAYFSSWVFMIYLMPPLAGFIVSVITGIFFGFYPARRAAALEPIVSLRGD